MPARTYNCIATTTLGSNQQNVSFTGITGSFTDLVITIAGRCVNLGATAVNPRLRFNSDTGSNYAVTWFSSDGGTRGSGRITAGVGLFGGFTSAVNSTCILHIQNYSNTTSYKTFMANNSCTDGSGSGTGQALSFWSGWWSNTSAITTIDLDTGRSDCPWGTNTVFSIYGIKCE